MSHDSSSPSQRAHDAAHAHAQSARALLLMLAPATVAAAPLSVFGRMASQPWMVVVLIASVLVVTGLWHRVHHTWTRMLASLSLVFWLGAALLDQPDNPARGLILLLGVVSLLAFLWPAERLQRLAPTQDLMYSSPHALFILVSVATFFGFDAWQVGRVPSVVTPLALSLVYLAPAVLARRQGFFTLGWERIVFGVIVGCSLLPLLDAVSLWRGTTSFMTPLGLLSSLCWVAVLTQRIMRDRLRGAALPSQDASVLGAVLTHPSRVLVISFLAICIMGTLLLGLPLSSSSSEALSWIDAAFTAVSATCVTGLIVVDTPSAFSGFGQLVVLLLIQIGGLGIMVFSAAAIVLLGKRLSLSHERAAANMVGASGLAGLTRALRAVFIVTLATEGGAAVLLFFGFLARGDTVPMAAWRAIFTAISAFCNAGFALQSDSLVSYADSPFILGVIGFTIIIGGLGPAVAVSLYGWRDRVKRTLHVRLVIWSTVFLLLLPALLILSLEWNVTLQDMSYVDRISNALFQSITLRTAGFNSVDLALVHPATWTIMILVMYVGGSPGSTAGGIKTTTFAVILLALVAVIRGKERVEAFGRTIPMIIVIRALAVATLGVLFCFLTLASILVTQTIPLDVAFFEVVSALATVGLSTGGTGALDTVGKAILIACMFAGRIGPLTLFVFLTSNTTSQLNRNYPQESVPIG